MSHVYLQAPAKINLTLAVLGRRQDGFHEIESCVAPIGLYDRLRVTQWDGFELQVEGSLSCGPDETNLVNRAAHALAAAAGCAANAQIVLTKAIPVGAGLGGGSSDAAATLRALSQLWGLNWPRERLLPIAATLGSDVPFFLDAGPAILRGRGEMIAPFALSRRLWFAVITPPYSLSTAEVYGRHHLHQITGRQRHFAPPSCQLSARELLGRLFNDLEPAAFACEPRLCDLHAKLSQESDRPIRMSGSGSSLYTLFDEEAEAQSWVAGLRRVSEAKCRAFVVPLHSSEPGSNLSQ